MGFGTKDIPTLTRRDPEPGGTTSGLYFHGSPTFFFIFVADSRSEPGEETE